MKLHAGGIVRTFATFVVLALAGCGGGGGGGGGGPAASYAIGVTVSGLNGTGLSLQVNGGGDLAITTNGAATFSTSLATGSTYSLTVKNLPVSPAQVCVVSNGSGTVAGANITNIAVSCRNLARFAYVANFNSSDISQFNIAVDGSLSPMAPPSVPAGGVNPTSMAVDPTGRYAYVANDDGTVSQFAIGANGVLSAMVPASVVAGIRPTGITVDPTGRYVYVSNDFGTVSQYNIGPTGGLAFMAAALASFNLPSAEPCAANGARDGT